MGAAAQGTGAQRLRARRARHLVTRFIATGGFLSLVAGIAWALGLPAPGTMLTLCLGWPVVVLVHHLAVQELWTREGRALQ